MRSLQRRLVSSLWLAVIVIGVASALLSYLVASKEAEELLDYQMTQVAQFMAAQSFTASGPGAVSPKLDIDHDEEDDFVVTVRDVGGRVLYASNPAAPLPAFDWRGFRTLTIGARNFRVYSAESGDLRLVIAQLTEARRETAGAAALASLLPVGLMLPVLGVLIGLVIRRELRPLRAIAAEVARRPPLALDPLPAEPLPNEILPLIDEINRLLARQRTAIEHEHRFIADAAHALRTPLAALQLQSDILDGARTAADSANRRAELKAGIRRVVRLADQLLALARSTANAAHGRGQVDLDSAVSEACELYRPIALARQVQLETQARSEAEVPGETRQLALLVGNLLDNACRHTARGGRIVVTTKVEAECATLEVVDEGPGLPETEVEKVFERFHRVPGDPTEGSGLGLAVVQNIVKRLGGRVKLENRTDGHGLRARVWLPIGGPCLPAP